MSVPKSASLLRLVIHSAALAIPVLFAFNAYSEPTVTVISPKSGATGGSPVFYEAFATSPGCDKGIAAMRIYSAPGVDAFDVDGAHIETFIPLSPGNYSTTVQAWDNCGGVGKTAVPLTVSDKAGVSVYLPTQGAAYWPVHVAASAESPECSAGISAIRIYAAPGVSPYTIDANKLDADVTLPPGNHNLTVQAWDNCGNVFKYPLAESVFSSSDAYLYASGTGSIAEIEINSDGSLRNPNGSALRRNSLPNRRRSLPWTQEGGLFMRHRMPASTDSRSIEATALW